MATTRTCCRAGPLERRSRMQQADHAREDHQDDQDDAAAEQDLGDQPGIDGRPRSG